MIEASSKIIKLLKERILYSDGAMGTLLQQKKLNCRCPEELNLSNPNIIYQIHKAYADAGADIIITNTFGANRLKLQKFNLVNNLKKINKAAINLAKKAAPNSIIAGDISELGEYIEPLGKITFDQAYKIYKEQVKALEEADILIIETTSDIKLLKAALIAAKESGKLIISSMTFEGTRTTTGTDVKTYCVIAESLGADIIGANCSGGPKQLLDVAKIITKTTNKPIIIQPNAGLPKLINKKTVFPQDPQTFSKYASEFIKIGVNILGGCCGTTPDHIKTLVKTTQNLKPIKREITPKTYLCSRSKTIEIGNNTLIVGERINPTGKPAFQEELKQGNFSTVRSEAITQDQQSADLLDINVGVPGTDEESNLKNSIQVVQDTVDLPLVIDTSNIKALENALKQSDGKPLINSVNAHSKSLNSILPLAKKYGAAIIALCIDETGIPKTTNKRVEIANKIIKQANNHNIPNQDIIIDPVTLTLATNPDNDKIILDSLKEIKKLGYKTILGISNISHGLKDRSLINQKFLTKAKTAGLSLAIVNPIDNIYHSDTDISIPKTEKNIEYTNKTIDEKLFESIFYGDSDNIKRLIHEALKTYEPLKINNILIKALESVGEKFNNKLIYLPQVLQSAKAMKIAFKILKTKIKKSQIKHNIKILFATVEHDIHDIGKNIVISILESHGYDVIDLGIDVPVKKIIDQAKIHNPNIIALSALMTTTAPEMEELVNELKKTKLKIPVIIGGAVITSDYAKNIDAAYSPNAITAVKTIKQLLEIKNSKKISDIIKNKRFTISVELVPLRNGSNFDKIYSNLNILKDRVDFISVTKGAGGSLRGGTLPLTYFAQEKYNINAISHFVCREKTRQEIENDLTDLNLFGIKNILALRGDPPAGSDEPWNGDYQYAYKLVNQINHMNTGSYLPTPLMKENNRNGNPTDFCILVAGHPQNDKYKEIKYIKQKIKSGAEVIITQMIFSFKEYKDYVDNLRSNGITIPVIAGIRPLINYKQALSVQKFFNIKVHDSLLSGFELLKNNKTKSKNFGINYTINMIKKLKKYGCPGVHFFIVNDFELLDDILDYIK